LYSARAVTCHLVTVIVFSFNI